MTAHCVNHNDQPALSTCHSCGRSLCKECLTEGVEYYYCYLDECQEALKGEALPVKVRCPVCSEELELTRKERISKQFICPRCGRSIDYSTLDGRLPVSMLPETVPAERGEYVSAEGLIKWLRNLLIAGMIVNFFAVLSDYREIALIGQMRNGVVVTEAEALWNDERQRIIALIQAFFYFGIGILFLSWFHRSFNNLRSFDLRGLKFSPRWAVGAFFIPLANIVLPFLVARQIWNASDPDAVHPALWKTYRTPLPVVRWWGSFLLWCVVNYISAQLLRAQPESISQVLEGCWIRTASDILAIPAAVFAILFIYGVHDRQSKKHEKSIPRDSAVQTEQTNRDEAIESLGSPVLMTVPDLGQHRVRIGVTESVSLERVRKLCRWLLVGHRYVILTPLVVFLPVLNLPRILGVLFAERRYGWIVLFLVMMLPSIGAAYIIYSSTRVSTYLWCLPGLSFVLYCLLLRVAAGRWLWDLTGASAEEREDD